MISSGWGALGVACICAFAAGLSCGGSTDQDPEPGATGGSGASTPDAAAGVGGAGGSTGGASGSGGTVVECDTLGENECSSFEECAAVFRADEIVPNAAPPPPGIDFPDAGPCCIGCEAPTCIGCHVPRFVGCLAKPSACVQSADELCGYLAPGTCD